MALVLKLGECKLSIILCYVPTFLQLMQENLLRILSMKEKVSATANHRLQSERGSLSVEMGTESHPSRADDPHATNRSSTRSIY